MNLWSHIPIWFLQLPPSVPCSLDYHFFVGEIGRYRSLEMSTKFLYSDIWWMEQSLWEISSTGSIPWVNQPWRLMAHEFSEQFPAWGKSRCACLSAIFSKTRPSLILRSNCKCLVILSYFNHELILWFLKRIAQSCFISPTVITSRKRMTPCLLMSNTYRAGCLALRSSRLRAVSIGSSWDPYMWYKENLVRNFSSTPQQISLFKPLRQNTPRVLKPNLCGKYIKDHDVLTEVDQGRLVWSSLTTFDFFC